MKNIFIVLTLVWFGFILNSFSANSEDFKKGLEAFNNKNYALAIEYFNKFQNTS